MVCLLVGQWASRLYRGKEVLCRYGICISLHSYLGILSRCTYHDLFLLRILSLLRNCLVFILMWRTLSHIYCLIYLLKVQGRQRLPSTMFSGTILYHTCRLVLVVVVHKNILSRCFQYIFFLWMWWQFYKVVMPTVTVLVVNYFAFCDKNVYQSHSF